MRIKLNVVNNAMGKDLTRPELAKKAGLEYQTLASMFRFGRCKLTTAQKVAVALGVPVESIIDFEESKDSTFNKLIQKKEYQALIDLDNNKLLDLEVEVDHGRVENAQKAVGRLCSISDDKGNFSKGELQEAATDAVIATTAVGYASGHRKGFDKGLVIGFQGAKDGKTLEEIQAEYKIPEDGWQE